MAHFLLYFSPEEHDAALDYMARLRARGETVQARNGKAFMRFGPAIEVEWLVDVANNLGTVLVSEAVSDVAVFYEKHLALQDSAKVRGRVERIELLEVPRTPVEKAVQELPPLPDAPIDFDNLPYAQLREKTLELTGVKPRSKAACMAALEAEGLL